MKDHFCTGSLAASYIMREKRKTDKKLLLRTGDSKRSVHSDAPARISIAAVLLKDRLIIRKIKPLKAWLHLQPDYNVRRC